MPTTTRVSRRPGELLREARRNRGLTLEQLSRRTGVATSTLSLYENAHRQPSVEAFSHLMRVLGLDLATCDSVPGAAEKAVVLERGLCDRYGAASS